MDTILLNKKRYSLKNQIYKSIEKVTSSVNSKCSILGNTPQEPDFIAELCLEFTKDLYSILTRHFKRYNFSVTGIFCHQSPIVNIGLPKNPELGDLLFVYIYRDKEENKWYNSLLLQAKTGLNISSSEQHQLELYQGWPTFKYINGKLKGEVRNIVPKAINDGAQYLVINNNMRFILPPLYRKPFSMGCSIPSNPLKINQRLVDELFDFFKFKSGRTFEEDPAKTNDDWTKMIWDLIDLTSTKASKRKNMGLDRFNRQITESFDGLCFHKSSIKSIFNDLPKKLDGNNDNSFDDNFNDEENAPAIILIESNEQQSNFQN